MATSALRKESEKGRWLGRAGIAEAGEKQGLCEMTMGSREKKSGIAATVARSTGVGEANRKLCPVIHG